MPTLEHNAYVKREGIDAQRTHHALPEDADTKGVVYVCYGTYTNTYIGSIIRGNCVTIRINLLLHLRPLYSIDQIVLILRGQFCG